jgi:predicted MFS family arabinose efflux permease
MRDTRLKAGVLILEGSNSFATTYYFYYFYFYMQKQFGFGDKANLGLAALNGFACMFAAWWGGRFAQRAGYFIALKLGFAIMMVALLVGAQLDSPSAHVAVMLVAVIGMCFTWPTLEALVSEGETPAGLQHMIGIYNVVWAGTGALAYFIGGALLDKLGLKSLFYVPAAVFFGQLCLTLWLELEAKKTSRLRRAAEIPLPRPSDTLSPSDGKRDGVRGVSTEPNPRPMTRAKAFLRMAWLANPFAYIAINTLVAVMPGVAQRLGLSTTLAGFYGSIWCFGRLGAFFALWFWSGWHYRFRWLLASYLALVVTFAVILTVPNLAVLVMAQLVLGVALGLIYYSSLFYSMDVGETKGEHGGIHEAAIGVGNFTGPAVGAASLYFVPQYANSGVVAVSGLLLCGLGALLAIWRTTKT